MAAKQIKGSKINIVKSRNLIFLFLLFSFVIFLTFNSCVWAYDLDSVMRIVESNFTKVNDYTCTITKKELINDDYVYQQNVIYKYRKPDNYYMKWTEGSMEGTETIYAGKKYNYELKVHLGGLLNLKVLNLDPKGSIAMRKSRHPITESNFGFTIQLMRQNLQKAKNEKSAKIEFLKEVTLNNRKAKQYRAEFPANKGFYGHAVYIYLDNLLNLPVKFEVYDWNNKLIESYTFSNIKINTGLNYMDFDINNKAYKF